MGIAFAAELLILAIIFCCTCIHLGKVHKKCTGKNEGMGHPNEEMCRAVAVKNGVGNFASLGIALMLYLWVQNIKANAATVNYMPIRKVYVPVWDWRERMPLVL